MAIKDTAQFKTRLEKLKKEIGKELKKLEKMPEFGNDIDPDIETQESEAFGSQLAMAQTLKNRLAAVDEALVKLSKGTYGLCENCKKEISEDLLKLVPESHFCKACKKLSK